MDEDSELASMDEDSEKSTKTRKKRKSYSEIILKL